jgi:hypothetical protein
LSDLPTVTVAEWTRLVRRARLGRTVKAIAVIIASYADYETGLRVHPGVARLAVEAEVTYNVAKSGLAKLRDAGLIELVKPARTRGASDEYRLILADDLLDRVDVLTPGQVTVESEKIRAARRGKYRPRDDGPDPSPGDLRPTGKAAEPVDNTNLRPTGRAADAPGESNLRPTPCTQTTDLRPTATSTCGPRRDPPPSTDLLTTTTPHADDEVRTAATGPRATRPPQDPNSRGDIPTQRAEASPATALAGILAADDPPPAREPCRPGLGWCVPCYAAGQVVLAADPTASFCAHHARERVPA